MKQLKYRIDLLLNELPRKDYHATILILCQRLGKSEAHFRRMRHYRLDSTSTISSDDLITIADVLGCSVDQLLNKTQSIPA